jgi:hypothetical protein
MWQKQADAFAIDDHAPVRELWYRCGGAAAAAAAAGVAGVAVDPSERECVVLYMQ